MTRTDRAWLIQLLQKYDEIEVGIKGHEQGAYTRDLLDVEKKIAIYIKPELIDGKHD